MSDPSGVQPPYLNPQLYPEYQDVQRKQALASMLMSSLQQNMNAPSPAMDGRNPYAVMPKRGVMESIAPIVNAMLAGKAQKNAISSQNQYFQDQYPQDSTGPGAGIISPQASPDQQAAAQAVTDGTAPRTPTGLVPSTAAAPSNPMIPSGMPKGTASALIGMMGPEKYAETFISPQFKQPEIIAQLRSAGVDPMSPQGLAVQRAALSKATNIPPVDIRPGGTALDPITHQPIFSAPQNGMQTVYDPDGNPTQRAVPGAAAAEATMTGAKKGAESANTPHYEPDPFNPGQFKVVYPPTPPALQGSGAPPAGIAAPGGAPVQPGSTPSTPATPKTAADLKAQEAGGTAGQEYSSELAKNATGATEVRRSLSELKNLASQSTPAATNDAKSRLGAMMIAAGMDPGTTSKLLGVDVGALQAAQKQTATLAVNTIHSMTSRGTNFDLDTFMRNNPNLNMADPAAFNRVVDYMDNKAKQEVAKQKDFVAWKKGVPADEWEAGHTAHWLDQQNAAIDQGQSNSKLPAPSLQDLQAEAQRRGLKLP